MDQSMDLDSAKTSNNIHICDSPLEFLVKVKHFVQASHYTEYNIIFLSEGPKSLTLHKRELENNIPPDALWKCFDQVDMLKKVKKYLKLIMELFIMRIEEDKGNNEKLEEWHNIFLKLSDCVFVFCSKEEYRNELIPVLKSFVDILLKKFRKVDMKDYPKEVFIHNILQCILRQFFQCTTLMSPILEEVIRNSHNVVEAITCQDKTCITTEEIVNNMECLNRYLNIVEVKDRKKIKTIPSDLLHNWRLLLKKILKVEVLPKYLSVRVEQLLDLMKYD